MSDPLHSQIDDAVTALIDFFTTEKDSPFALYVGEYYKNLFSNNPRKKTYSPHEKTFKQSQEEIYKLFDTAIREQNIYNPLKSKNPLTPTLINGLNALFPLLVKLMGNKEFKLQQLALEDADLLRLIYQFAIHCQKSPLQVFSENKINEQRTLKRWQNWTSKLVLQLNDNNYLTNEEQYLASLNLVKAAGTNNEIIGVGALKSTSIFNSQHQDTNELCLQNSGMALVSLKFYRKHLNPKFLTKILEQPHNQNNLAVHLAYTRDHQLYNISQSHHSSVGKICKILAYDSMPIKKQEIKNIYLSSSTADSEKRKNLATILDAQETNDKRYCPLPCDTLADFMALLHISNEQLPLSEKIFSQVLTHKIKPTFFTKAINWFSGCDTTTFNDHDSAFILNTIKSIFTTTQPLRQDYNVRKIQQLVTELLANGSSNMAQVILDKIGNELDFNDLVKLACMDKSGLIFNNVFNIGRLAWLNPSVPQQKVIAAAKESCHYVSNLQNFRNSIIKIAKAHAENEEIVTRIFFAPNTSFAVDYSHYGIQAILHKEKMSPTSTKSESPLKVMTKVNSDGTPGIPMRKTPLSRDSIETDLTRNSTPSPTETPTPKI